MPTTQPAPPTAPSTTTTPITYTHPLIHTASAIAQSPTLGTSLITLINTGWQDPLAYPSSEHVSTRFASPAHLLASIGEDGFVVAIYASDSESGAGETPVACACASKWTGDLGGRNAGKEDGGWEVKAVTSLPSHRRAGLVGKCLEAVSVELVGRERARRAALDSASKSGGEGEEEKEGEGDGKGDTLKVWVHAVEEYNGDYWRRRGWRYVRGYDLPAGHFISPGAPTGFRLAVLIKEVDVL